jgi:PhoD-like phosphatase
MTSDQPSPLVVGPLLRYVDHETACLWAEVADPGIVTVRAGSRSWAAHTFTAHSHHYAYVVADGLAPATSYHYQLEVAGQAVWPAADSPYPPSRFRTFDPAADLSLLFGSCRESAAHDGEATKRFGVDVLRAYALRMAYQPETEWPHLFAMLGDQVYADETSGELRDYIESRRDTDEPPGEELKDFEEYTQLYRFSWSDAANRWMLASIPSTMIFDDHDIRDDWNTSHTWRTEMRETTWWQERIVGGLASYWIYQHLGNLSPADLDEDEVWQHIQTVRKDDPTHDFGAYLDKFAARVDEHPDTYRWSYRRDLGNTRLVVVDSRASRVLTPDRRTMLDDEEMAWLDRQLTGDVDVLLVGTSLPFLLGPGLHHAEAWNEAVSEGAWGKGFGRLGEKLRQGVDFEHWAAFEDGFHDVAVMILEVAAGGRGTAPASTIFLSGDVHHSYLATVEQPPGLPGRIVQAVCSPIRNPMPRAIRRAMKLMARTTSGRALRGLARSAKAKSPELQWTVTEGPWFDNCLASLNVRGRSVDIAWESADLGEYDEADPNLRTLGRVVLPEKA